MFSSGRSSLLESESQSHALGGEAGPGDIEASLTLRACAHKGGRGNRMRELLPMTFLRAKVCLRVITVSYRTRLDVI